MYMKSELTRGLYTSHRHCTSASSCVWISEAYSGWRRYYPLPGARWTVGINFCVNGSPGTFTPCNPGPHAQGPRCTRSLHPPIFVPHKRRCRAKVIFRKQHHTLAYFHNLARSGHTARSPEHCVGWNGKPSQQCLDFI